MKKLEDSLQECKTTAYNLVGDRVGGRVESKVDYLIKGLHSLAVFFLVF